MGQPVTIGRPVPGMKAWVLNEKLEEVPDGEQGELCLGGVPLARGYMNEPEMTARKFPVHPRLGRIYRTGDLVQRGPDGNVYCHGRIDTQVKIRGYRIELEAIEARLSECAGVRAAACRVQGEGAQQKIVAFVVPEDIENPPAFDALKDALKGTLPAYMVPNRFGILALLPTTVSGKLNRRELPVLEETGQELSVLASTPRSAMEEKLAAAVQKTLHLTRDIAVESDFFNDLGGDSLLAAQLISRLRDDPATAALTVRCLYEARTIAELARRAEAAGELKAVGVSAARPKGRPVLATLVQTAWLVILLVIGAPLTYLFAFEALPWVSDSLGLMPFLLLAPFLYLAGVAAYTSLMAGTAVLVKKLLIGRYEPTRAPVWGSFYVRNWIVQRTVGLVPWRLLEGTVFQQTILRLLGARIGRRVHIHRGVNLLLGGWDLLDIGADVTLSQDAHLQLVELEDGQIVVGPVDDRAAGGAADVRAGVAGGAIMEAGAYLTALSFLARGGRIPAGERWEGIPAKAAGAAPVKAEVDDGGRELSPALFAVALLLGRLAVTLVEATPAVALTYAFSLIEGIDAESAAYLALQSGPRMARRPLGHGAFPGDLAVYADLPGDRHARTGTDSGRGDQPMEPGVRARLAEDGAARIGKSLAQRHAPLAFLVALGRHEARSRLRDQYHHRHHPRTRRDRPRFLPRGRHLPRRAAHPSRRRHARAGPHRFKHLLRQQCAPRRRADDPRPRAARRQYRRRRSRHSARHFLVRPAAVRAAQARDRRMRPELDAHADVGALSQPRLLGAASFHAAPLPVGAAARLGRSDLGGGGGGVDAGAAPGGGAAARFRRTGVVLSVRADAEVGGLLGRVKPGVHPLWSCWYYRWEFHYVAWDLFTAGPLATLEGTLLLNWYLRAMGARIGREVALGSGFAYIIDHDMLAFEDGATVSCMFQAHTFEDRVLKIDRVAIRRDATVGSAGVLLYGADIGEGAYVSPHSVVMKHERLLPHRSYAGCPTQQAPE